MRPITAATRDFPTAFRSHVAAHLHRVSSRTRFPARPIFSDNYNHYLSLTMDEARTIVNELGVPVVVDFSGRGLNDQDPPTLDEGLSEQLIHESLKTTICLDADDDEEDPKICVVCQDSLCQENQTIGKLKCGHEFHESCIKEWLRQKNACPLCKAIAIRD